MLKFHCNLGAGLAGNHGGRVLRAAETGDVDAIDGEDHVARLDSGPCRRRVLDRHDHSQRELGGVDLDADPPA